MKKIALFILMLVCMPALSQSNWTAVKSVEQQEEEAQKTESSAKRKSKKSDDARYLVPGCVPTDSDGHVVFTLDMQIDGASATEIYDKLYAFLDSMARDEHQNKRLGIAIVNSDEHKIVARYNEWMVFSSHLLSLDQTEITYTVVADCMDGGLHLTFERISYAYEVGRDTGFQLPAHEVITDNRAVNKKHTRLLANYGKFRRKTIDRVDEVFNQVRNLFNP